MSTESKAAVKEIRELLKRNEHTEAVKRCKKLLKKEKNNYKALILLGAAMREVEEFKSQTPLAFQKAIDIQPDNPLAWQGLVAYYEKELESDYNVQNQLIKGYCKLIELISDTSKVFSILEKITNLLLRKKDNLCLNEAIEALNYLRENVNTEKQSLIDKTLAFILTEQFEYVSEFKEIFENVLENVIEDNNVVNRQDYYRKYLKILYSSGKITKLLNKAVEMHKQFIQDICPLEWICKVYYEESIINERHIDIDIPSFYESLRKLDIESESSMLAEAVHLDKCGDFIKSREVINNLIFVKPQSLYGWIMLSKVSRRLYCWEDMENAARKALQLLIPKSVMWDKIHILLIESLSRSNNAEKWKYAEKLCKEVRLFNDILNK